MRNIWLSWNHIHNSLLSFNQIFFIMFSRWNYLHKEYLQSRVWCWTSSVRYYQKCHAFVACLKTLENFVFRSNSLLPNLMGSRLGLLRSRDLHSIGGQWEPWPRGLHINAFLFMWPMESLFCLVESLLFYEHLLQKLGIREKEYDKEIFPIYYKTWYNIITTDEMNNLI